MAREETDIAHRIMLDSSKVGARLWKNVRGLFFTKPEVIALIDAAKKMNPPAIMKAIKSLRQISAGVQAKGSSDLIGFRPLVITQEMVGSTIAVFCAIEVKTESGAPSPEQLDFNSFVIKNGGFAGVVTSPEEAKIIMKYSVDR